MMPGDTLPRLLRRNAATLGTQPAMREKSDGVWRSLTWSAYEALVLDFARGLAEHGFAAGDRLAVIGGNRPQLYAALLAAQALGGIGVPLWPDADTPAIAATLRDACVRIAVAEQPVQLARLLAAKAQLPDLELVVSLDPGAVRQVGAGWITDCTTLCRRGAASTVAVTGLTDGRAGDVALLLSRAGQPAIMLSHANLLSAARAIQAVETLRPTDEALCFLPMAWVGDMLYSLTLGLSVGFACNCAESSRSVAADLRDIRPHFLAAPPAVWRAWLRSAEDRIAQAPRSRRVAFAWACHIAGSGAAHGLRRALADHMGFASLRGELGLARLRWAHSGGMPVAPEIWQGYRRCGVNLRQSYGPAELAGMVAVQSSDPVAADSVGMPAGGTQIRIAADGEIQVRGPTVCIGFDGSTAATRARTTCDGWWRTGDAGALDAAGGLLVYGPLADLGQGADGGRFVPAETEWHLRRSYFIADALAIGCGRPFVAAIVVPHHAALHAWAQQHGLPGSSLAELAALPEARALLREELRACNAGLPAAQRVRRFLLLDEPLEAADSEASVDRSRFRQTAIERHAGLACALFDDAAQSMDVPDDDATVAHPLPATRQAGSTTASFLERAHG